MKKMEFMAEAAKIIMDFFSELYVKREYVSQSILLKLQQGTFQLKCQGGIFKLYVYKTGSISYNYGSDFLSARSDYSEYYHFNDCDDHAEVLKKFKGDLRKLKKYLPEIFLYSYDGDYPLDFITFQYSLPFSAKFPIKIKPER